MGPDEPLPVGAAHDEDEDEDEDGGEEDEARRTGKARGQELEQERALEAGLRLSDTYTVHIIINRVNPKNGLAGC